jgi:hypothetical protein
MTIPVGQTSATLKSEQADSQAPAGTLTFAPGETSQTIIVLVNGDRLAEPNESDHRSFPRRHEGHLEPSLKPAPSRDAPWAGQKRPREDRWIARETKERPVRSCDQA